MHHVTCRLCEGRCGLLARVDAGRLAGFEGDQDDAVSHGFICDTARRSLGSLAHPARVTQPRKRQADGSFVDATWDEAIADIGARLRAIRKRQGASGLGLYLGEPVQRQSRVLARSLAVGVGLGTPNILSTLALGAGPRLQVTEWMLGQATPLLPDLGRTHAAILLGGDPTISDWGPMQGGMRHDAALAFSRRTKNAKVTVAGPRRHALARAFDQHISLPPGREGWLLLGMLVAIVQGGWQDDQYLRDYTVGFDRLAELLRGVSLDRCAQACGMDAAQLSGLSLKFSRAAMGVVHAGHGSFTNAMPTVSAWAWLALHAVTANVLRPGGLYAHPGVVDLQPALEAIPSATAPRTRVGRHPLLLLQAPGPVLADEVLTPGPGALRALIAVDGDPLLDLPGNTRTAAALDELELYVQLCRAPGPASRHAHWVLPLTHPWEQDELNLLDHILLPVDQVALSPAVVAPPEGARTADEILRALLTAARPGLRGGAFGAHLSLGARLLGRAELGHWEERLLDWLGGVDQQALEQEPHRSFHGETNRAEWRVSHDDGRLHLVPDALEGLLARLEDPRPDPELPALLRTSARRDRAPDALHRADERPLVYLHPDHGVSDGATVHVETRHGRIDAIACLDDTLRSDTVDVPRGGPADAMALLATDRRDPITGTPELDGVACRVVVA